VAVIFDLTGQPATAAMVIVRGAAGLMLADPAPTPIGTTSMISLLATKIAPIVLALLAVMIIVRTNKRE
jgi:hypothetical protein